VKPHYQIAIEDCREPLIPIPLEQFAIVSPHPYVALGAPYGAHSPYYLRQGVLESLLTAQTHLQTAHPGWHIQIFDAYRPMAVQQFMVDYTYQQQLQAQGLTASALTPAQKSALLETVYQFWAPPSLDPTMPPPHSTGAAVDITLVDDHDQPVSMGSPIDEVSARSYPDHFASQAGADAHRFHHHRQILKQALVQAGFAQHPKEWWAFLQGRSTLGLVTAAALARETVGCSLRESP
jgi:D-alanyl-D-alanine dipeptidase